MTKAEISILKKGGIGIIPTDTLYGIVGSASSKRAVERIYEVKGRDPKKPLIVLISALSDLHDFGITIDASTKKELDRFWPGPVSVILPVPSGKFEYLHRGTNTIAFRMPGDNDLRNFLRETGPLVAPSANPEGKMPAHNVEEARNYFGSKVDFYYGGDFRGGKASTLVSLEDGVVKILRE